VEVRTHGEDSGIVTNLLFLMADQHNRRYAGCYGHPIVRTPNLDRLAARGARFDSAYCTSPICVPARASLATGRYAHQLGTWDNAFPYIGGFASWGHRVFAAGVRVVTVGKLHYRSPEDDTGFMDQRLPMHVKEGVGDLFSLIRDRTIPRPELGAQIGRAGAGESSYTRYDDAITREAVRFLATEAAELDQQWALFVSWASPHHPLIAPARYIDAYPLDSVVFPKDYAMSERPMHPVLEELRRGLGIDTELDETTVRRATASYYALCSFIDDQVGAVIDALERGGWRDTTVVLYTSDHGDTVGDHGLWWKHTMYEGSAGVPLLLSGPGIHTRTSVSANVSHVDIFPTILDALGIAPAAADADLPGRSLLRTIADPHAERTVFGEYHAIGSVTGYFMIRGDRYKYVHYVGYPPQLFDLRADPEERIDLGTDERYAEIRAACLGELRTVCDPDSVNAEAFAAQRQLLEQHGGLDRVLAEGFQIPFTPAPQVEVVDR
jgi:choline-sulfatase